MRLISEQKIQQFREELKKRKIDAALFLTSEPIYDVNIEYFTGLQQVRFFSFSCLLISQNNSVLVVSPLSHDQALMEAEADEIINLKEEKDTSKIDLDVLKKNLNHDISLIRQYFHLIKKVKIGINPIEYKDPKLKELKLLLNNYFQNGSKIPKILIFSQFKDTIHYIFNKIKEWDVIKQNSNLRSLIIEKITGDTSTKDKEVIIKRFAPGANDYEPNEGED